MGVDAPYFRTRYPAEFQNDIFFTDVTDGEVYVVDANDGSDVKYLFSTPNAAVAFRQGPDGYVYVANLYERFDHQISYRANPAAC